MLSDLAGYRLTPEFTVAMLAGGSGQRLGGRDKSQIVIDGDEIGVRTIVTALLAGANEVIAIGGDPTSLSSQGWKVVADLWPGEGPLGGLITALKAAKNQWVVVVGCDQPDLAAEGLVDLLNVAIETNNTRRLDAALSEFDGHPLVTHSVWNVGCVAQLEECFASGERSVNRLLPKLSSLRVQPPDVSSLADIDTPDDLARYT